MPLIDLSAFAKNSFSSYHLEGIDIDESKALQTLEAEITATLEDLNSPKTQASRASFFNIPGAKPLDYGEHVLSVGKGRKVICGIRHKGGDINEPFVEILTDFWVSRNDLLDLYQSQLASIFKVFAPKRLRYYSRKPNSNNQTGLCYLAQFADKIIRLPPYPNADKIELIFPTDASYYPAYKAGYQAFHQQFPDLKNKVPLNDLDLMEESREAGLLRTIWMNGECIGLIAAESNTFLGVPSIYFLEIFLQAPYKGKGLAKSIQQKFIKEVAKGNEIIWGTIDSANIPSYRTALANGRIAIRFEQFLPL